MHEWLAPAAERLDDSGGTVKPVAVLPASWSVAVKVCMPAMTSAVVELIGSSTVRRMCS